MKKGLIPGIAVGAAAAAVISATALLTFFDSEHKHKYTSSVAQEATCDHSGLVVYTCDECGERAEEITAPLPHSYAVSEKVEPTFDHGGYTVYKCRVCGNEYRDDEVPALEKILDNANVELKASAFEYTGSEITLDTSSPDAVKVYFNEDEQLTFDKDFELEYSGNVNVGIAEVTVKGKGDWKGSRTAKFMIYPAPIALSGFDTSSSFTVQWAEVAGADGYELVWGTDPALGEGAQTVRVEGGSTTSAKLTDTPETGKKYYVKIRAYLKNGDELLGSFGAATEIVVKAGIGEVTLSQTKYTYGGKAYAPDVVVKDGKGTVLKKGTDYTVAYANNIEPGTASVTVTGTGVYSGLKTVNFTIAPAELKDVSFVGMSDVYLYTGKPVEPSPTLVLGALTLEKGKDYDVSYSNNTAVGMNGSMTFTFKGKVSGTVTKNFKIEDRGWETSGGQTYFVENGKRYTTAGMRGIDGSTYYFGSDGALQKGWIKVGEDYYCFDRINGKMYAATNVDGVTVGADGKAVATEYAKFRITTMMTAHKIMLEQTLPTDTMEQKRLKCFNWVLSFPYKQWRLLKNIYDSSPDWEMTFANDIFRKGSGDCVSEAAATAFLFREIGYTDVYICHDSGHSWVTVGGKLFDPVFAEARDFNRNYNIDPYDYRKWPFRRRRVDGKAYDGAPS